MMTGLAATLANLARQRAMSGQPTAFDGVDRLGDFDFAGSDPGALQARCYVPAGLKPGAPLVVVLHGCTQTASAYDAGSGWSQLADEQGFALLFPEQQRSNNPNRCFNWFSPVDSRRGSGEALSIRQMIAAMVAAHALDERRIYITGLSAGGAMAAILLATYPELFAGGAIIAGLPFGVAASAGEAFARMRGEGYPPAAELGALVAAASTHPGPWPHISAWHGSADTVVAPSNAEHTIGQWRAVHGVGDQPAETKRVSGATHRIWRDASGRAVIESYTIPGMGHGTPVDSLGADRCGASGPFMLEAGISSTRHIARAWGLAAAARPGAAAQPSRFSQTDTGSPPPRPDYGSVTGVGAIIEGALRAAGLMR